MSRDQNGGRRLNTSFDNNFFERLEQFKYLGKTLTHQNSEEIKNILKAGNTCYHSVKNLLSSSLLSKNLKIKIHRTIILLLVLYRCETWSFKLRGESRLKLFENRVTWRIIGHKMDEVTRE